MRTEALFVFGGLAYVGSMVVWGWIMSMLHTSRTEYADVLSFCFKTNRWRRLLFGCGLLLLAPIFLILTLIAYVLLIVAEKIGVLEWLDSRHGDVK